MPELIAEDVGHAFGRRVLFRGLSFRVTPETPLAVTGANGAGKSTLVQILAGLLSPLKGTVTLDLDKGRIPGASRARHVGFVAPYLNVYEGLTARENLHFILRTRGLPAAHARIAEALDLVGLTLRADERVETFSSGMKQRVKYAVALLPEPPLLILDEPTANFDPRGIEMVARVRAWQRERSGLLVIATNDAAEAAWATQRVSIGEEH